MALRCRGGGTVSRTGLEGANIVVLGAKMYKKINKLLSSIAEILWLSKMEDCKKWESLTRRKTKGCHSWFLAPGASDCLFVAQNNTGIIQSKTHIYRLEFILEIIILCHYLQLCQSQFFYDKSFRFQIRLTLM